MSLNHRNHRKIVVIDGRQGFTGGMNVGDEYAGLGEPWQDAHVRVSGPASAASSSITSLARASVLRRSEPSQLVQTQRNGPKPWSKHIGPMMSST